MKCIVNDLPWEYVSTGPNSFSKAIRDSNGKVMLYDEVFKYIFSAGIRNFKEDFCTQVLTVTLNDGNIVIIDDYDFYTYYRDSK